MQEGKEREKREEEMKKINNTIDREDQGRQEQEFH